MLDSHHSNDLMLGHHSMAHAVLGPRLIACADLVLKTDGGSADQVFGAIDAQKLHSSMTLFLRGAPDEPRFAQVLDQYFDGLPDSATDERV